MSANRILQVLLFQQSSSPSQYDPGPGTTAFWSLNRVSLLLKTLLFLSIFSLRYSRCFSWISLMMSSSSQSYYCLGRSLKRAQPMPKPGFLMIRSGSSYSSLMTLVAMSLQMRLQLPTAGQFFFSSTNLRSIFDLNADVTSFSSPSFWGLYEPGPGFSYSYGSLLLASVDPNCPRQPLWILQISLSSRVFLGSQEPGPGILALLLIRDGHLSSSVLGTIFLLCFTFLPKLKPTLQLPGPRLCFGCGLLAPESNLLLSPKVVVFLPDFALETLEIQRQEPGPGVVSSIYSYQLSSSESSCVEGGAFYEKILLSV